MEPFKNVFHRRGIALMAEALFRSDQKFDRSGFTEQASHHLESLELKQRSKQIYHALAAFLPEDFLESADIITRALHPCTHGAPTRAETNDAGIQGWLIMPLAEYAGLRGGSHLLVAMGLMRELTMRFTAEFGIRHLLIADHERCLTIMQTWISDENEHVRRLVSEGTRPRLPWGLRLHEFVKNPRSTLPLLNALRDDPSEYVRRSVANHLNDIAKDHPQLVLDLAEDWHHNAPLQRKKLLRHAMRNLLKQGHSQALSLYEMSAPLVENVQLLLARPRVAMGENLMFKLAIKSAGEHDQRLRLDIVLFYRKANGSLSPKVFRWKDITLAGGECHEAEKGISFRAITTRSYYAGVHRVEIKINGVTVAGQDFELISA